MFALLLIVIYLAFISLGLPDSILGAAWPSMYQDLGVPLSAASVLSPIVAAGTIVSSLLCERLLRKMGTGMVALISVSMTAAALIGSSFSNTFWMLCLWAVPLGLGAGGVDAALNNFVALNYPARHMSWLHCFWGVGATAGPALMGAYITRGFRWTVGYQAVGMIQIGLAAVLVFALPLWKKVSALSGAEETGAAPKGKRVPVNEIPGAKIAMVSLFCYSAVECTAGFWASSYMVEYRGLAEGLAAQYTAFYYLGITAGRLLSGFVSEKLGDKRMVRIGQALMALGALSLLLPMGSGMLLTGLLLVGFGCAPVFPSILHATPAHFGRENSQRLMGVQMASAYLGTTLMAPLFGVLAGWIGMRWMPEYVLLFVVLMTAATERLERVCQARAVG